MAAQLYTERIGEGAQCLLLTHGIYGSGGNWRAIARKLVTRRPEWSVLLVDLRQHGRSEGGEPPHTIAAAAGDLRAVVEAEGISAIAGHSFGGKVVLQTRALVDVTQTWVLDASPSARPDAMTDRDNSVLRVLELLEQSPLRWAKREDFVGAVVAAGFAPALGQWLAMNLVPDGGELVLRLDTAALRALLTDYYAVDLWDALLDPARGDVELVIAERSNVFDAGARARLATPPAHVHVHAVAADHWLHIEAADAVVELFATRLR